MSPFFPMDPASTVTIPSSFPHKLTRTNHLVWEKAILTYLKSQDLQGYIDGSVDPPPSTVTSQVENVTTVTQNPDWLHWHMRDQLVLSILISSLTETVVVHVVKCTTARELWVTLKTLFTSKAKSRTLQIHYQLATIRKGDMSIADYFQKLTGLADTLAAIDQPLNEFDLVSFLLAGLNSDYDSFVTSVTTRVDPISLE
jgi:hypothetical protein